MKTKLLSPADLGEYTHPAIVLFRSIELKCTYENTKGKKFRHPSLDLGSGDGYLASLLFDEKFTYGLDNGEADDYQIAIDKDRYEKVLLESAEHMSLPDNYLQFVFCNSVIEHIPDNEAVLSEVARTLKKGGDFIFTSPSDNFKEYLYLSNIIESYGQIQFFSRWSPRIAKALQNLASWYKNKRHAMLNHYHTLSHTEWQTRLKRHGLRMQSYDYYISRDTCMFWDRLALQVRFQSLLDKGADAAALDDYRKTINEIYRTDSVKGTNGASLFIHAIKI